MSFLRDLAKQVPYAKEAFRSAQSATRFAKMVLKSKQVLDYHFSWKEIQLHNSEIYWKMPDLKVIGEKGDFFIFEIEGYTLY